MIGIGIDTGGTTTDAVIYDTATREILSTAVSATTKDALEKGIGRALDGLDRDLVKRAELVALSTTLATNAALENIGSRAKGLMIGMNPECMANLEKVYASYGLNDLGQLVFIDGKPEHIFRNPEEPDWETLAAKAEEWFHDCGAVGITQVYPEADGGRLELRAKEVLQDRLDVQVTTSHEMFDEVDVLKRSAGTLLNARLVPLIAEFLKAVRQTFLDRGLSVPIAIVRSDGSLMTEKMAKVYPAETLLSGPAASAVGGSVLAKEEDALIIDMGGTTTDVAIVRGRHPLTAKSGITIGQWKTSVRGLYVDTFLLGGDSAVRFRNEKLFLDGRRVLPISVLAAAYPEVTDRLRFLAESERTHTRLLHEFFVLQKAPVQMENYSAEEQKIITALARGPRMLEELASDVGESVYTLHTERLESEGVVIRSGLTPTDMMAIRGDYQAYDPTAALLATEFVSRNVAESPSEIPMAVYRLVEKKMYCGIARILLERQHPKGHRSIHDESAEQMVSWAFDEAWARLHGGAAQEWVSTPVVSSLPLVGVGAPIHIFLPDVAEMLGTKCVICEHAAVANAIGAIANQIVTRISLHVKADYDGTELTGYSVSVSGKVHKFISYREAEAFAVGTAKRMVSEKSRAQGASAEPDIRVDIRQIRSDAGKASLFFESVVEAVATDIFQV